MPHAVAMFEHGLNPHYFANPPALHLPAALPVRASSTGAATGVAARLRAAPRATSTRSPASPPRCSARARCGCCTATGARLFGRGVGPARGGDRGGRVPAGLLRPPGAQRRADARAADAVAAGHAPACCAKGARATTCSPASASAWPARASTPPGSCWCRCSPRSRRATWTARLRAPRARGGRDRAGRLRRRCAAFLIANPYAVLDYQSFHRELVHQSTLSAEAQGKLGAPRKGGLVYYLWSLTWGLGWVPALAALAGAVAVWRSRAPRLGWLLVPGAAAVPRVHGPAGPLLRALAAADLPDPVPARGVLRAARWPSELARVDSPQAARAPAQLAVICRAGACPPASWRAGRAHRRDGAPP